MDVKTVDDTASALRTVEGDGPYVGGNHAVGAPDVEDSREGCPYGCGG